MQLMSVLFLRDLKNWLPTHPQQQSHAILSSPNVCLNHQLQSLKQHSYPTSKLQQGAELKQKALGVMSYFCIFNSQCSPRWTSPAVTHPWINVLYVTLVTRRIFSSRRRYASKIWSPKFSISSGTSLSLSSTLGLQILVCFSHKNMVFFRCAQQLPEPLIQPLTALGHSIRRHSEFSHAVQKVFRSAPLARLIAATVNRFDTC